MPDSSERVVNLQLFFFSSCVVGRALLLCFLFFIFHFSITRVRQPSLFSLQIKRQNKKNKKNEINAVDISINQPLRVRACCFCFLRSLSEQGNYGGKVAASFSPLQGACLVHGHGRQCLLHEGAAVTAGVKYLLRTDVMYS